MAEEMDASGNNGRQDLMGLRFVPERYLPPKRFVDQTDISAMPGNAACCVPKLFDRSKVFNCLRCGNPRGPAHRRWENCTHKCRICGDESEEGAHHGELCPDAYLSIAAYKKKLNSDELPDGVQFRPTPRECEILVNRFGMKEFRNFPPEDMKATMHAPAGTEAYKPFMTRHLRDERRRLTERRPRAPSLDDRGRSADRAPERQGQRSPAYIERSHNTDRSYSVYSRSLIRNPDDYSDRRNSGDDYWKQRALDAEDEVEELKDKLAETEGQLRRSRLRIEQLQAKTQSQEFEINQLVGLGPNLSPFSTQGDQPRMYSFQGGYSATFDRSDQRNLLRGHYSGRDDSPRGHHRGRDKSPRSPSTGRNGAPARAASLRRLRGPGKDGRAAPSLASRITREVDPVLERKKEELASKKRKLEELCAANAARDAKLRELKEARNCRRGGG